MKTLHQIKVKSHITENNYLDSTTGEVLSQEILIKQDKIIVDNKEAFALAYASIVGVLNRLNGNDVKLLTYCSIYAEYNTNRISLTKPICEEITRQTELPYQSIRNSITKLIKANILIKLGSGTYRINPRYYWKGNSQERLTTMNYILEIECPGC